MSSAGAQGRREQADPARAQRQRMKRGESTTSSGSNVRRDYLAPLAEQWWKRYYEAGEGGALLELIVWYLASGRPPPANAATEFCKIYDRWLKFEVASLDRAFGVERTTDKRVIGAAPSQASRGELVEPAGGAGD
jgi:hypothetical protein